MKKITRRDFLRGSVATTLVGSLAGFGMTANAESDTSSVLKDGKDTEILMVFPGNSSSPASLSQVEDSISAIISETVDAHIKLQILEWGVYSEQTNLMLSSGESVDIVFMLGNVQSAASSGQILEITDYMDAYAQDAYAQMGQYIDACYIDGSLYGFPTYHEFASRSGLVCSTELFEETGYSAEDVTTWDDVEAVLQKVQELHPDIDLLVPANVGGGILQCYLYGTFDTVAADSVGVYMDGSNDLTVVNEFDTDEFMAMAELAYDWNQKGYFIADANTITETRQTLLKTGTVFGYIGTIHPGTLTQETTNAGIDITVLPITEAGCGTSNVASYQYCVAAATSSPEKTMAVLNLIYSNTDIQNLLRYGIEGTDYVVTDGIAGYPDGVDSSTVGWSNENWLTGNCKLVYPWVTDPEDIWEQYEEYNDGAVFSPAYGFLFDTSNVKTAITAISNVLDKYTALIYSGLSDPAESVASLVSELESAGINEVIEEVQSELDAWAESNE
ncbi:MAG: extracellular solute-binding protein [Clostridiales bacterium]|nr:extracellular solute-binding protein [Clostridiales bacterium]